MQLFFIRVLFSAVIYGRYILLRSQWKSGGNVAGHANMCEYHVAFCWGKYFEYIYVSFIAH